MNDTKSSKRLVAEKIAIINQATGLALSARVAGRWKCIELQGEGKGDKRTLFSGTTWTNTRSMLEAFNEGLRIGREIGWSDE